MGGEHAGSVKELPREVIEARLRLAEVLDDLIQAGDYDLVLQVVELERSDLRLLAKHARHMAAACGQEIPGRPRTEPPLDEGLQNALNQIEAAMGMAAERKARAAAGENVSFLSDQLEKRQERLQRRPKPGLML